MRIDALLDKSASLKQIHLNARFHLEGAMNWCTRLLLFVALLLASFAACIGVELTRAQTRVVATQPALSIHDIDFEHLLTAKFRADHQNLGMEKICAGMETSEINMADTVFGDLDGDGLDEAAVMAFSCFAGTSGPDLTAVYKMLPNGKIVELQIEVPSQEKAFQGLKADEVSLRLRAIKIEKQTYIEEYTIWGRDHDDARDFSYRWDGRKLALIGIKDVPIQ